MAAIELKRVGLFKGQNPNLEITDPGIQNPFAAQDEYIAPQEAQTPTLAPAAWAPIRWIQTLLAKRHLQEEAGELIAKIEKLPSAPDNVIRYFFDNDFPRLVSLSRLQPLVVQQMLRDALNKSPDKQVAEPWFRLVQIGCGDVGTILPALDSLC